MTITKAAWIPEHEVYCAGCRRMVAAIMIAGLTVHLVPAAHFQYWNGWSADGHSSENRAKPCRGWTAHGKPFTHGMEDPGAAFSDKFRYTEYSDSQESIIALGAT